MPYSYLISIIQTNSHPMTKAISLIIISIILASCGKRQTSAQNIEENDTVTTVSTVFEQIIVDSFAISAADTTTTSNKVTADTIKTE